MITHFGINTRDHILIFQKKLIESLSTHGSVFDDRMSSSSLGKNLSSFICKKDNKTLLVILDVDDGSGGTPADCKINWSSYNLILNAYKPHDMIVLKSQVNRETECNQFYPFKDDVYAIGIFSNDPDSVFRTKELYPECEKDIDVFYAGGYKHVKNRPYAWPKHRDIRKWWSGASIRGYEKLREIESRRRDIKFALYDDSVPPDVFYSLLRRSKICIDLPGVGLSSRKFYECMVFGKCVISLRQQVTPWPCEENQHYISLGDDLDFDSLEEKITSVLADDNLRETIEKNVLAIENHLNLNSMIKRIQKIIDDKFSSMTDDCILKI